MLSNSSFTLNVSKFFYAMDGVKEYLKIRQGELAPNVSLQLTLATAQAGANVPATKQPYGCEARAETTVGRRSICNLLGAVVSLNFSIFACARTAQATVISITV
jgi:hypothetical protein